MPTITAHKDYNELHSWDGDITNLDISINPAPSNMQQRGRAMLRCFREEEELLPCRQN